MMLSLEEVIERIKDIISLEIGDKKVRDYMVSDALEISRTNLSNYKKKDVMPMEEIAAFCADRKISINWLVYDQKLEVLKEETEKHIITV